MILLLAILFVCGFQKTVSVNEKGEVVKKLKPSNLAGRWYPGHPRELKSEIDDYLKKNGNKESRVGETRAVILPHAGYTFSGNTIAQVLTQLIRTDYERVWIFAPSHHEGFNGFSSPIDFTHYETPLGEVPIAEDVITELKKSKSFHFAKKGHQREHSIEIELPFLQVVLENPDFEIIPILLGNMNRKKLEDLRDSVKKMIDPKKDLVVVSSDFSHYGSNYGFVPFRDNQKENLKKLDMETYRMIEEYDIDGFISQEKTCVKSVCGRIPIALALLLLEDEKDDLWITLEKYQTSGDIYGDYKNSVSYLGISFHEKKRSENVIVASNEAEFDDPYSDDEKAFILTTVRNVVTDFLRPDKEMSVPALPNSEMKQKFDKVQGCFVTYHKDGQLRGCIGHIFAHVPLFDCIMQNTISAATRDTRFSPMTYDELVESNIHIEVSILTDPTPVTFKTSDELLSKIRPKIDGVILRLGRHQSTYLPIVWDQLPQKESFFSHLCRKAGLRMDCWKKDVEKLEIHVYQSIVFEE